MNPQLWGNNNMTEATSTAIGAPHTYDARNTFIVDAAIGIASGAANHGWPPERLARYAVDCANALVTELVAENIFS